MTEQDAIKELAALRRTLVKYRRESGDDESRLHVAQSAPLAEVVEDFLFDMRAHKEEADRAFASEQEAIRARAKAIDDLQDAKRPFTSQMRLLNLTVGALNTRIEELESQLSESRRSSSTQK